MKYIVIFFLKRNLKTSKINSTLKKKSFIWEAWVFVQSLLSSHKTQLKIKWPSTAEYAAHFCRWICYMIEYINKFFQLYMQKMLSVQKQ